VDPSDKSFYLFLPQIFIKDHYKRLVDIYGEGEVQIYSNEQAEMCAPHRVVNKINKPCARVLDSFAW